MHNLQKKIYLKLYTDKLHTTRHWHAQFDTHAGDMNSHSTFWYPYTDDHIDLQHHQQLYNHTTLNTDTPTRVPNTTYKQRSSSDITSICSTLYNNTTH